MVSALQDYVHAKSELAAIAQIGSGHSKFALDGHGLQHTVIAQGLKSGVGQVPPYMCSNRMFQTATDLLGNYLFRCII
jgi:hypothetical protein